MQQPHTSNLPSIRCRQAVFLALSICIVALCGGCATDTSDRPGASGPGAGSSPGQAVPPTFSPLGDASTQLTVSNPAVTAPTAELGTAETAETVTHPAALVGTWRSTHGQQTFQLRKDGTATWVNGRSGAWEVLGANRIEILDTQGTYALQQATLTLEFPRVTQAQTYVRVR